MKRIFSVTANQTIAVLIFITASITSVYGQEVKTPQEPPTAQSTPAQASKEPAKAETSPGIANSNSKNDSAQKSTNQTTNQSYVFPTRGERFNRYVKNTVGP